MLNSGQFKSQELVASFFPDTVNADWDIVCDFFSQLFGVYQLSESGLPLHRQILLDWDLMTDDDTAVAVLSEVCARPELSAVGFVPDSRVVYQDFVSSAQDSWRQLKDCIKLDTRFLIDIKPLEDSGLKTCLGASVDSYNSENQLKLYRARIMEKEAALFTHEQMGMPPVESATAGRANPVGIPYFYACTDPSTCYYEVRAAYLDKVAVATFVVREGCELHLANLNLRNRSQQLAQDSDPIFILRNRILLNAIGKDLSTPMRRHDNPMIEYLPTQFICEYIRKNYEVDGIMFQSSVHKDGCNVVLFNMDKVKCVDVREWEVDDITINASLVS